MLNRLDATLQTVCPTVMVPSYEALPELVQESHRFLAAKDGLYLDVRRSWLQFRVQIAPSAIPLPYGAVAEKAEFLLGAEFSLLLCQFIGEARAALPKEHAAWLSFDLESQTMVYEPAEIRTQSIGHISYDRPRMPSSRRLAVDIHSHGHSHAFFSDEDDQDDVDDVKLSIVVGNLDKKDVTIVARLVAMGTLIDYSEFVRSLV